MTLDRTTNETFEYFSVVCSGRPAKCNEKFLSVSLRMILCSSAVIFLGAPVFLYLELRFFKQERFRIPNVANSVGVV